MQTIAIEAIMDFSQIPMFAFKSIVAKHAAITANANAIAKDRGSFRLAKANLNLRIEGFIASRTIFQVSLTSLCTMAVVGVRSLKVADQDRKAIKYNFKTADKELCYVCLVMAFL